MFENSNLLPLILSVVVCIVFFILYFINIKNRKKQATGNQISTIEPTVYTTAHIEPAVLSYFQDERETGCLSGRNPLVTDEMYEEMIKRELETNANKNIALKALGLSLPQLSVIDPICFKGYEMQKGVVSRYGLDGKYRTSQYSATWIFFSDKQMYLFNFFIDLLHHTKKTTTLEYFYKDITSITAENSSFIHDKLVVEKGCLKPKSKLEYVTIDNSMFYLTVANNSFFCSVSGVPNVEKTIQLMKERVRERKTQ